MTQTKSKPRRYTPDEKVAILREHFLDQKPVSEICRAHELHVNMFYRWQKTFFEGGAAAFEKSPSGQLGRMNRQIEALEAQLVMKNEVLAEITETYVRLKKSAGVR